MHPKGRRSGGRHLGFLESVHLRGWAWERRPWPARKPNHAVSQKEPRGAAQRRTLQVFRGNGLVTGGVRQGCEEGSSRHAWVLRSALSTRVSSCGRPRRWQGGFASLQDSSGSLRVARLFGGGHLANAGERRAPRGVRASAAGEGDGARGRARTSNLSAEVGRRRRSNETAPQRQKGGTADGDLAHV